MEAVDHTRKKGYAQKWANYVKVLCLIVYAYAVSVCTYTVRTCTPVAALGAAHPWPLTAHKHGSVAVLILAISTSFAQVLTV